MIIFNNIIINICASNAFILMSYTVSSSATSVLKFADKNRLQWEIKIKLFKIYSETKNKSYAYASKT